MTDDRLDLFDRLILFSVWCKNPTRSNRMPGEIWCHCYGTPEPDGPWIYPDDTHADTCGIDAETLAAYSGPWPAMDRLKQELGQPGVTRNAG